MKKAVVVLIIVTSVILLVSCFSKPEEKIRETKAEIKTEKLESLNILQIDPCLKDIQFDFSKEENVVIGDKIKINIVAVVPGIKYYTVESNAGFLLRNYYGFMYYNEPPKEKNITIELSKFALEDEGFLYCYDGEDDAKDNNDTIKITFYDSLENAVASSILNVTIVGDYYSVKYSDSEFFETQNYGLQPCP